MFVDEDCVESMSDVDDLRTRDCLYVHHEHRQLLLHVLLFLTMGKTPGESTITKKM